MPPFSLDKRMKVIIKTDDDKDLEIGFERIYDSESDSLEPLLWFETEKETVTVPLANLSQLINVLKFLKEDYDSRNHSAN